MKNLIDIIQNSLIDENIYDSYSKYQEQLYESILHSYDPKKLIQTLEKEFGHYVIKYYRLRPSETDKLCPAAFMCTESDERKILNDDRFKSILNLFNYSVTERRKASVNGHSVKIIILEPNITGDYTETVYKEWNGIVYHITLRKYLQEILRIGLRPKGSNNPRKQFYRKFDERIFVTGGPDWEDNTDRLVTDLGLDGEDYVVLKIDLKKNPRKIRLFRDPIQQSCLGLYTREPIDKECISVER